MIVQRIQRMCKACEFKDFLMADLEQLAHDNPADWLEINLKKFLEGIIVVSKVISEEVT